VKALENDRIRKLGRRFGLRAALHRTARGLGYDLVKRHYYSEVPDLDSLPPDIWTAKRVLPGVDFDIAAGLRLLRDELFEFIAEFDAPALSTGDPRDFYYQNTFYEGLDAETLYAMVRRHHPRRVLELGSGMSTLVIARARQRNGLADSHHDVYDPFSRAELRSALVEICDLHPISATDVPLSQFAELDPGDFLFVDTTHTVKIGSDVNRLILDVLPTLAPGVLVHFHDIYLPYEYPIAFFTELGFSWAEQYLLQAFLALNPEFEILFGNAALAREHPDEVRALVPSTVTSTRPSAFWIRRRETVP
jgi:Methyltransferase domain